MTSSPLSQSVRQRLLNLSRVRGEDFQLTLVHFAIERLLYRLGSAQGGERFLLKGAMLFALWSGEAHRPTRDLDLAGQGDPSADGLAAFFRGLCGLAVPDDGLFFDGESVQVAGIREQQEYQGQRVRLLAYLGSARIQLQVDIGFGDAVTPTPEEVDFPTLLDMPAPRLRVYPRETVIAEKLHALTTLGLLNSRMKDFYDLPNPLRLWERRWLRQYKQPLPGDRPLSRRRHRWASRPSLPMILTSRPSGGPLCDVAVWLASNLHFLPW